MSDVGGQMSDLPSVSSASLRFGGRMSDVGFTFGELRFASVWRSDVRSRISDFGGKMSEVGCSKLEFRNWKLEIRN